MHALILAAGKGTRMRELTRDCPKPLLEAGGRALIEHQLVALAEAGFSDVVINTARFSRHFRARLGGGEAFGLRIVYSEEGEEPLETGGGIRRALPLLGGGPFAIVNADVFSDFELASLPAEPDGLVHLVLVPNPPHNPDGDFGLADGRLTVGGGRRLTYGGIAVLRPELFSESPEGRFPLAPLLRHAASQGLATGELYEGFWLDVGTPERLAELDRRLGPGAA